MNTYVEELYESEHARTSTKWLRVILDAKYKQADLNKVTEKQCKHLTEVKCNELLKLLQKAEELSDGTLDIWKTDPVDFRLKEDANPICSRPYPVPKLHEGIFQNEVECLVLLGLLERANDLERGAPSFAQPKPKSNRVCFLSDFRNLNKNLRHKPYPMRKINGMLLMLEGFQYAMPIGLNMVYYHIRLSENTSNLCSIILPYVKYRYKRLPMVIDNYPDICQHKMNDLFHGYQFVRAYIYELLILTK